MMKVFLHSFKNYLYIRIPKNTARDAFDLLEDLYTVAELFMTSLQQIVDGSDDK